MMIAVLLLFAVLFAVGTACAVVIGRERFNDEEDDDAG